MKKLSVMTILLILSLFMAKGQDKSEDISHLMSLMQIEKMVDGMMGSMQKNIEQQMSMQIQKEAKDEKAIKDMVEKIVGVITSEVSVISKRMVKEDLPSVYDKLFTQPEIKDLIRFYESPTGQKLLAVSPQISEEIMMLMTTKYMPSLNQKIMEVTSEITLEAK